MTIAVLYIDDEMYHLEIAKTFLERSGECEVDTASSGKEALEKMKGKVYDAVVSDYVAALGSCKCGNIQGIDVGQRLGRHIDDLVVAGDGVD